MLTEVHSPQHVSEPAKQSLASARAGTLAWSRPLNPGYLLAQGTHTLPTHCPGFSKMDFFTELQKLPQQQTGIRVGSPESSLFLHAGLTQLSFSQALFSCGH
jgi:hypothetical protein